MVSCPGGSGEDLESQVALQGALDALENRYKEPFLLVFLAGFSCREVAEQLSLPLGTVLSRIHRARQFLRERLSVPGPAEVSPPAPGHGRYSGKGPSGD